MLPAAHAKRGRSCRRQRFFRMENIVNSFNSLYKAYRKTRCGKRDNPTAMRYRMEAIERTADLSDRLQRREYTFGPYYPFKVYEPKERLVLAKHFFTNQTKTAASWGVKIKVKLLRGSAEGDCYIQSVGGNFA